VAGRLLASETARILVVGYGFNFADGPINALSGTLTGFLGDGSPLNLPFLHATTATIELRTLPEPGVMALLAIAALFAAWRRARRHEADC
jgi:hypothetical protein